MGDAEYISTPPLSCKPNDELGSNAVEQKIAKELENWAIKCFGKNVCNLLSRRNFEQAQHLLFVQFADEMLFEFEVFVSSTYLRTSHHGAARCIVFIQNCWRKFIFGKQELHKGCNPLDVFSGFSGSAIFRFGNRKRDTRMKFAAPADQSFSNVY